MEGLRLFFQDGSWREVIPEYNAASPGICVRSLDPVFDPEGELRQLRAEADFLRDCVNKL